MFASKNISPDEMLNNINKAKKKFYSISSIIKRIGIPYNEKNFFILLTNLGSYFSLRLGSHKSLVKFMYNSFSKLVSSRKKYH